jgi:pSer/pThr/pTyr-binding forkhead associated (FHA) protein
LELSRHNDAFAGYADGDNVISAIFSFLSQPLIVAHDNLIRAPPWEVTAVTARAANEYGTFHSSKEHMICVLDVLAGPAAGKRIWLKQNQCLEIGRMSTVDFAIPADSFLSRRHLLIDSTGNLFRVRDVGSANGTYLNDRRIDVEELSAGDIIRAGNSVFAVSILDGGENPHRIDGTSFGKTMTAVPSDSPEPCRTLDFSGQQSGVNFDQTMRFTVEAEPDAAVEAPPSVSSLGVSPPATPAIQEAPEKKLSEPDPPPANRSELSSVFQKTNVARLYELDESYNSPLGAFCGALQRLAGERWIHVVFNHSQLDPNALETISTQGTDWQFKQLSQSLFFVSQKPSDTLWRVIQSMVKQDAMVCLVTERMLSPADLSDFANSLGFPSLFSRHVTVPKSLLTNFLVSSQIDSLFEWDRNGRVGLFQCHSSDSA